MTIKTFMPSGYDTVQLSANGTASATVAVDPNSAVVRVYNAGPNLAYIRFGSATDAATTAKIPIAIGSTELFTKGQQPNVAAICDAGNTAVLFFTAGEGI